MKKLNPKTIHGNVHFGDFKFADESDFEDIKKLCSKQYYPIMVSPSEMESYDVIILKNGDLIGIDDEDVEGDDHNLCWTFYTIDMKTGMESGSIFDIPDTAKFCTFKMTEKAAKIWEKINELKRQLNSEEPCKIQTEQVLNYLSQEELDFLNS